MKGLAWQNSDVSGTTNYSYDSMDRLTQKQTPEGTLNYTYDAAGNLATMQSADGAVNVSYSWDSLDRLQTVVDSRLGTTTYAYDNANNCPCSGGRKQFRASCSADFCPNVTDRGDGKKGKIAGSVQALQGASHRELARAGSNGKRSRQAQAQSQE
jgi:YD repeat-containing protein